MTTRFIALTSADEGAMTTVTEHLTNLITQRGVSVAVLQGVRAADEANAVYVNHGELWCVGDEPAGDELAPLVDRWIHGATPERLRACTHAALDLFLGKTRVAA